VIKSVRPDRGSRLLVLGAVALALYAGQVVSSQGRSNARRTVLVNGHEAVEGEVLVRFNRAVSTADRVQMEQQLGTDESEAVAPNTRRLRSRAFGVSTLVSYMRTRSDVAVAEPNYIVYAFNTVPNDPLFGNLWGLFNNGQTVNGDPGTTGKDIHAAAAWDVSTGSAANVVAVIDTGIDYTHPDLVANIWSAPSAFDVTIGGTTVHCPAGAHGFNAIAKTCDPMDDNNHGTHVSGTIGARGGNGMGVTGVNGIASIMGSKFLDAAGSGTLSNAIDAIEFAIQAKQVLGSGANVRVLSNSWGGGGFSQLLLDEINKANTNNMLFVAAAGNAATNTDVSPSYPASYTAPNVVAVAATDNDDFMASFSNYGKASVDLGAPGVNILSTTRNNTYAYYNGTSMATPHVSGAAALVLSACALDTAGLKSALLNTVDVTGALTGRVLTNGRLNVDAAIRSCANVPRPAPPAAPVVTGATPGSAQVVLTWTIPAGATSFTVKRGTAPKTYSTTVATGLVSGTYTDKSVTNGTTYYYVVDAVNAGGSSPDSNEVTATPVGLPPAAPTNVKALAGNRQIALSWSVPVGATSFTIKRGIAVGSHPTTVATGVRTNAYVDGNLTNGTTYYYVVVAAGAGGSSVDSAEVFATPFGPPLAPTGLVASSTVSRQVSLKWTASAGATSYTVKRSTLNGAGYSTIATNVPTPSFVNTGLKSGRRYYYVVSAVNAAGASANSSPANVVAK